MRTTDTNNGWTRGWLLLAVMATFALLFAACGTDGGGEVADEGDGQAEEGEATDEDGELFEMGITVTHYPALLYTVPYAVALENGFFEEEGISITEISGSSGGGTTVRNVLTGGLPFGETATPAAANAYIAGAPIVAVGGGVQSVAELNWVTMADSDLGSIEDLAGQSVGYTSPGSVTEGTLNLSLDAAGIDVGEVDDRAMGGIGEGLTALSGGGIDAAANMEPIYSSDPDPYEVVFWVSDHVPSFQQTIVITSPEMVEDNPEVVESFIRARARAIEWINDNPEEAAAIWATEADIDEEVALTAIEQVLPHDHYGVGFSLEGLQMVDEQMHLIGLVDEDVEIPWDEFIDQDFLPDDAEQIDVEQIRE